MRASEATFLAIDWEMKFGAAFGAVDDRGEPERSIAGYDGRIFAVEGGGLRRRVGRVCARRCLLGEASPSLVLTADLELAAYAALFTRAGRFLHRITRRRGDLLVLDRLGLVSDYRGRGLGLTVIREVTRQLGPGCAVAALIPSPMSYEHVTGQFTRVRDDAAAGKLARHYRRLGFRTTGTVLHFDLGRTMRLPGQRKASSPGAAAAPPTGLLRRNSYIVC